MRVSWSQYPHFHWAAAKLSWASLWRRPWSTFMTVAVIAITLLLPALFWVFSDNLQQLTRQWQQGGHISLFLVSTATPQEQQALLGRIRHLEGVGDAQLKSPAEGLVELQEQEGMQNVMQYLPENPLPALITVIPSPAMNTPEQLEKLFLQLNQEHLIEQAKLDLQWIQRLYAVMNFAKYLAHALLGLLDIAVVFIIGNTLKAVIHHRQDEIQVLKLIGATDAYILRPFLYTGMWYGLLGALLSIVLLNGLFLYLTGAVNQLAAIYQMHYPLRVLTLQQTGLLMLVAVMLGWLSASLAVRRQLSFINPCH